MKKLLILGLVVSGCSATVPTKWPEEVHTVCVQANPKVEVLDFKAYLEKELTTNGVDIVSSHCDAEVRYSIRKRWDITTYNASAVLGVYDTNGNMLGGSSWINGNLFFKFISTKNVAKYLITPMFDANMGVSFSHSPNEQLSVESYRNKWQYGCGDCDREVFIGNLELDYVRQEVSQEGIDAIENKIVESSEEVDGALQVSVYPVIKSGNYPKPNQVNEPIPEPVLEPNYSHLSGGWVITQSVVSTSCDLESYLPISFSAIAEITGNYIKIQTELGNIIEGEIKGDRILYSGQSSQANGVKQSETVTLFFNNDTITGNSDSIVTFPNSDLSCRVETEYSGIKI